MTEQSDSGVLAEPHAEEYLARTESAEYRHQEARSATIRASYTRPSSLVLAFGNILACSAGLINATAIRTLNAMVTNMTGNTSHIALDFEGVNFSKLAVWSDFARSVAIVFSFMLGAFTCGLLIDKTHLHFTGKSLYGTALVGTSALLVVATFIDKQYAPFPAAMASGLQNAMCTSHFGAIVRTTHVTGTVTDIGSGLGRIAMLWGRKRCRGRRLKQVDWAKISIDARKMMVLCPIFVSFMIGCFIGGFVCADLERRTFLIPAIVNGLLGVVFHVTFKKVRNHLKGLRAQGKATLDEDQMLESMDEMDSVDTSASEDDEDSSNDDAAPGRVEPMRSVRRVQ